MPEEPIENSAEGAAGEALDLLHGASFTAPQRWRSGSEYDVAEGSDVVVITAGLRRKPDETRLDLINRNLGQRVLISMVETGRPAAVIVEAEGLAQVSDEDALTAIVRDAIAANPVEAAKYRAGNLNLLNFLIGQVMKATRGKANQTVVRQLLEKALAE